MSRRVILTGAICFLFSGIAACGTTSTPTNELTILPKDCRLLVGEQMPLALDGQIPPNSAISWDANQGSVISAAPGLNALFVAPMEPAIVAISVSISSGTPGGETPVTRHCIVTSRENLATPTSTPTIIALTGSGGVVASTLPQETATISVPPQTTIIISEVMANPCGSVEFRKWNQYVELYNYGDQPVDVSGWWLADQGEAGTPDQLVSWWQRNPNDPLPADLISNSTIIPAHGFAVIVSPIYTQGAFPYTMPYRFPKNTVILTPLSSRSLGDDFFNIIGDEQSLDTLVLYKGSALLIAEVVSTYGTPKLDPYVANIRDDNRDNLPLDLHECGSAERIFATGADAFDNWREITNGTPGEAPY